MDGVELATRLIPPPGAPRVALLIAPVIAFAGFGYAFLREFRATERTK